MCVWFSRKLYRLYKVQQLIKFLTFRSVHFHPRPVYQTLLSDFSRVWLRDLRMRDSISKVV